MRRILSLLREYRQEDINQRALSTGAGASGSMDVNARLQEVAQLFGFVDNALNGISPTSVDTKLEEAMTSADFTNAILTFVQRQMVKPYEAKVFNFDPLVKPDTTPNYLSVTRLQRRAGLDDLEYVQAKAPARPGSVVDATKKQYRVYQWKKQFDFDRQLLVNDDLGYFTDHAQEMGRAARRTLEKYVSRFMWNAVTIARLIFLGALYSTNGRLTTARISTARMAFSQRVDTRGNPIAASLKYIVHHPGLTDVVAQIQASTLVPELATNAANIVKGTFTPIEDPYTPGNWLAGNLPWFALADWRANNIIPFVLARRQGLPSPMLLRKKSDIEGITTLLGGGSDQPPIMGDFATGNVTVQVWDEWGTYIDATEGNMFDSNACYYSSGIAP